MVSKITNLGDLGYNHVDKSLVRNFCGGIEQRHFIWAFKLACKVRKLNRIGGRNQGNKLRSITKLGNFLQVSLGRKHNTPFAWPKLQSMCLAKSMTSLVVTIYVYIYIVQIFSSLILSHGTIPPNPWPGAERHPRGFLHQSQRGRVSHLLLGRETLGRTWPSSAFWCAFHRVGCYR